MDRAIGAFWPVAAAVLALALAPGPARADAAEAARALFGRGEGAHVQLVEGGRSLPAQGFACANCHGADALGRREGTTRMPPIRWSRLSRPTGTRPAYDPASLARAVVEGGDPAGRVLDRVMPRYDVAPEVAAALAGALAGGEAEQQAGIGPAALDLTASGGDLRLTVTDSFPQAADWARSHGGGRAAAQGYAMGLLAVEAAIAAGRDLGHARFLAALRAAAGAPVAVREIVAEAGP